MDPAEGDDLTATERRQKCAARSAVQAAIKRGELVRPRACSRCRRRRRAPEAHHLDYSKPLAVIWLCKGCHAKEHRVRCFVGSLPPLQPVLALLEDVRCGRLRELAIWRRELRVVGAVALYERGFSLEEIAHRVGHGHDRPLSSLTVAGLVHNGRTAWRVSRQLRVCFRRIIARYEALRPAS